MCIRDRVDILQRDTSTLLRWFSYNEMKPNAAKSNLLVSNGKCTSIKIGNETIKGNKFVKLLGVTIDNKVNFTEHINVICKKASQKLHALARIAKYMNFDKLKIIMKAFFESQFSYCPLIWMFHSRTLNNKINKLHERALRIVYKNSHCTFQQLLKLDNTVTIHHRNLQRLATEMYKIKNNLSPIIIREMFPQMRQKYNLRNNGIWKCSNVRTVKYGTETMLFRGPKTWEMLPDTIKYSKTIKEFKRKVKLWIPDKCTCRLCITFISNLGFINC